MTLTCQAAEELLQAHLDGELTPGEAQGVDAHLAGCAPCRGVREELAALGGQLRGLLAAREQVAVPVAVPGVVAVPGGAAAGPATPGAPAATPGRGLPAATPGARGLPAATGRGRTIGGYRIDAEIARGGMGTVYRATQLSMDRPVALKVLAPKLAENQEFVARFLREARTAATLTHPNLVTIYDVGQDGNQIYYSMELIEGEDAEAVLARDGFLPPRRAVEVALGVARALSAAARAGVVHRDIKPANVLLTKDGGVKLADLGLAKAVEGPKDATLTVTKRVIGSPNYMSPEQAGDLRAATHRSDLYSLGATLLHLLSGEVPFAGGAPLEVIARVLRDPPPLPARLPGGEDLDEGLRDLLARLLAKDPAERPESADALVAELEGWLAGAATARGASRSKRLGKRDSGRLKAGTRGSSDHHRVLPGGRARTSEVGRTGPPVGLLVGLAAAVLVAAGLVLALGGGRGPVEEVAPRPTTTPPAPKPPSERPPAPRPETGKGPSVAQAEAERRAAEAEADRRALADLRAAWDGATPPQRWRRASQLAGELTGSPLAGEVEELRAQAKVALEAAWAEVVARAKPLEADERWAQAAAAYQAHAAAVGDAPTGVEAQLAARSLEAQVAVRLEGDLAKVEALLARGETREAAALLDAVERYGGPDAAARARERGAAALAQRPAPTPPAATEATPVTPAQPAEAELAAKAARERRVREALAEARRKLDAGDLDGAQAALAGAKDELASVEGAASEGERLAAAIATARARPDLDDAAVLALVLRAKVEALPEGRVQATWAFEAAGEAEDWEAVAPNPAEEKLVDFLRTAEAPLPQGVGAAWSIYRKTLVGHGWGRRRLTAGFRTDRPLTVELEARAAQSLLVGLAAPQGRDAVIAGLGYQLEDVPIQRLPMGGRGGGGDKIREFLGKLATTVGRSRDRGPSLAVLRERDAFLNLDELVAVAHRPLGAKNEVTVEVTPDGEDTRIVVKHGKRQAGEPVRVEDVPDVVRPTLVTFGATVPYDQVVITGVPEQALLERAREAIKAVGADGEAVRRRLREQKDEEKRRREEEERRRRERERNGGGGGGGEGD